MAARNKQINLLPQQEFDASIAGRVLKWAMSTFRIIVVVTEMVVMGAFLSRFWLDAQISDLNDQIGTLSSQISLQSDFEKNFRNLQDRIAAFNDYAKQSGSGVTLTKVTSKVPQNVTLQSISLQNGTIQIKGTATSEIDVTQFISNLKADTTFKDVSLGQVSSSEGNQSTLLFNLKVSY